VFNVIIPMVCLKAVILRFMQCAGRHDYKLINFAVATVDFSAAVCPKEKQNSIVSI